MTPQYEKMIEDVATDIAEHLADSALHCAWSATPIPVTNWTEHIVKEVKELVQDILDTENRVPIKNSLRFWRRFAQWRMAQCTLFTPSLPPLSPKKSKGI
jgi:hypothetical protein